MYNETLFTVKNFFSSDSQMSLNINSFNTIENGRENYGSGSNVAMQAALGSSGVSNGAPASTE